MIKIDSYHQSNYCRVYLEIEPILPAGIREEKIGLALANKSSKDYLIGKDIKIYKIKTSVPCSATIDELKKLQKDAQAIFSEEIRTARKRMEELKLLQKLIKKEETKNGRKD